MSRAVVEQTRSILALGLRNAASAGLSWRRLLVRAAAHNPFRASPAHLRQNALFQCCIAKRLVDFALTFWHSAVG
jgi:hypothetical protein